MRKIPQLLLTTGILACLSLQPVMADEWHDHGGYGRDDHRFHEHDGDHWRGGNWFHGFHDGRDGWWWQVDGTWYYYNTPVYPYPESYAPPTVIVEQAPAGVPAPYTYYCSNPPGYYPSIPECYAPWQRVGAAPPPPARALDPHEADMQQLNTFSAELQEIDSHEPHAVFKLKALGKRLEKFRHSLYSRSYNAMDVLRDAEDLQHRITVKREEAAHPAPPPLGLPPPPQ